MNRQMKRNINKINEKYPQELRSLVHDRMTKMLTVLFENISEIIYETLRNNRVGEERANRIADETVMALAKKLNKGE